MLWGPVFILETLKITAGKFIVCYRKVKDYSMKGVIKTETDMRKDKESLSIIINIIILILSHIMAPDMRQKF